MADRGFDRRLFAEIARAGGNQRQPNFLANVAAQIQGGRPEWPLLVIAGEDQAVVGRPRRFAHVEPAARGRHPHRVAEKQNRRDRHENKQPANQGECGTSRRRERGRDSDSPLIA